MREMSENGFAMRQGSGAGHRIGSWRQLGGRLLGTKACVDMDLWHGGGDEC